MLKPINYYMLEQMLNKVERLLSRNQKNYISLPTDSGFVRLEVGRIYYAESLRNQIIVYAEGGEYAMRNTMKKMEAMLGEYNFVRCNSGYLINLAYVSEISKDSVTVHGVKLPVSRSRSKIVMEALTKYLGG